MAFDVVTAVVRAAVFFFARFHQDFGAFGFSLVVVGFGVGDDDESALGFPAPVLVGLIHVFLKIRVADWADHDHAVAKSELGVNHFAFSVAVYFSLFEAERFGEKVDGAVAVAVVKVWNDVDLSLGWTSDITHIF